MDQDTQSFVLGRLTISHLAQARVQAEDILEAIARHSRSDWGEICTEDAWQNKLVLTRHRGMLLSAYRSPQRVEFYVCTYLTSIACETTVLLPKEYWSFDEE